MTHELPGPSSMAALRTLRRAAHHEVTHHEVELAAKALIEPIAVLGESWNALRTALALHRLEPGADSWDRLQGALVAVDGAVGLFLGPSGWEPSTRR